MIGMVVRSQFELIVWIDVLMDIGCRCVKEVKGWELKCIKQLFICDIYKREFIWIQMKEVVEILNLVIRILSVKGFCCVVKIVDFVIYIRFYNVLNQIFVLLWSVS